jgi:iron complex transport system substrate-binding protein
MVRRSLLAATAVLLATGPAGAATPGAGSASPVRIVSLHDVTTEIVVALGAVDRLVGAQAPVELPGDVQAAVARVPRVAGLESILAVSPTLVLGMATVGQRSPELVAFLRRKGVQVWLGHPATLPDVLDLVTEVGQRAQAQPAAAALVARLRAQLKPVPRQQARSAPPVPVFVYDCCDPAFTAGGGAVLTDVIARAGGRNLFAELRADWTKVSWESVLARRPRLILVHDYQYEGQDGVARKLQRLARFPSLAGVPTVVLPLGQSLGGLRSFLGLQRLREAIARLESDG